MSRFQTIYDSVLDYLGENKQERPRRIFINVPRSKYGAFLRDAANTRWTELISREKFREMSATTNLAIIIDGDRKYLSICDRNEDGISAVYDSDNNELSPEEISAIMPPESKCPKHI